jgi:hypothetical protein
MSWTLLSLAHTCGGPDATVSVAEARADVGSIPITRSNFRRVGGLSALQSLIGFA